MRVMTANVRLDDPKDGENGWLKRRELLVRTLLKYQSDILACQEESPAQGAYLHRELAAWYAYYPRGGVGATNSAGGGAATGVAGTTGTGAGGGAAAQLLGAFNDALASLNTIYYRTDRFDILDGEAGLVLPGEPQANPTENTFFTLAVLRERRVEELSTRRPPPATVIVVDVHFRHTEAFAVRCAERLREKIAGWLEKYPGSGVVLTGDINWDRTSKLYSAITAEAPLALRDTFDYTKMPAGKNGSYHAFTGQASGAWPTDLIFCGGALKTAVPAEMLRRNIEVTDCNAAFFDVANSFAGCIAGLHEVLRRQGLLEGIWCLDPEETLSPGQSAEIDRVYRAYPHLNDDAFVAEHRDAWLR